MAEPRGIDLQDIERESFKGLVLETKNGLIERTDKMLNSNPTHLDTFVEYIKLPKSDKRYKVGNIQKDKRGNLRGNPETVELKRMEVPNNAPLYMQLNPPLTISPELAKIIEKKL